MIEDMRNRIAGIETHLDEADAELMPILLSVEVADVEESNLDVFKRLEDTLEETLVALSAMATHYQDALGHRKIAEEAITASGVSIETEAGARVLDAVSRGGDTIGKIMTTDTNEEVRKHLGGFKYQLIAYERLERAKIRADDYVRKNVDFCSESLDIATDISTDLKKVL